MANSLISFVVVVKDSRDGKVHDKWLTAARTWTEDKTEAIEFRRWRLPTNRQQIAINDGCHDIAGGFRKWLDLTTAESELWDLLIDQYVRTIWPPAPPVPGVSSGGSTRPPTESEEEAAKQWALIEAQWNNDRSSLAAGLREMRRQSSRIRFMAQWPVLCVDLPKGWESLADLPDDPPGLLNLLMLSWDVAVEAEEARLGN